MKKAIREHLDRKNGIITEGKTMATEQNGVYLTPEELQTLLTKAIAGALSAPRTMTPLEQRQYTEQAEQELRRNRSYYFMGKAEEERERTKKLSCSHMRDPKLGQSVSKGTWGGEWTTGGQLHSDNTATIICMRCGQTWTFKITNQERANLEQGSMLGVPVPDDNLCIEFCGTCGDPITKCDMAEHKGPCRERYDREMAAIDDKIRQRNVVPV